MSMNLKYITIKDVSRIIQISEELIWTQLIKTGKLRPMIYSEHLNEHLYIDVDAYKYYYEQDDNHTDIMFLFKKDNNGQYKQVSDEAWDNVKKKKLLYDIEDIKPFSDNLNTKHSAYPKYFSHNVDYSQIMFHDTEYIFRENAAKVVKYLCLRWKDGLGAEHFKDILFKVLPHNNDERMSKVFRCSPEGFKKIIKSHGKGCYSINL